jgi:hypothetical protein
MKQFRDTDYYVTEDGIVYSKKYHPIQNKNCELKKLKPYFGDGYLRNMLYIDGKPKNYSIHRMVAECYIPNPNNLPEVNHDDGDKTNNHISNLYWCTRSNNMKHAHQTGLWDSPKGESNGKSKLTEEQVKWIRQNYIPRHPEFGTRALGRKFNVKHSIISNIINNKRWRHI